MLNIKPSSKGDPLCPLGFHPQVRWPTRCKRCFRDYKEHGNRSKEQDAQLRKDELTVSTPALSYSQTRAREELTIPGNSIGSRNWTSSSNLSSDISSFTFNVKKPLEDKKSSSSWTSSPNLAEEKDESVTINLTLPRRRPAAKSPERTPAKEVDDSARKTQYTVRRRTASSLDRASEPEPSSFRYRERSAGPPETETSRSRTENDTYQRRYERSTPEADPPRSRFNDTTRTRSTETDNSRMRRPPLPEPKQSPEVDYILQVKSSAKSQPPPVAEKPDSDSSDESSSSDEDTSSIANTETTETTIVNVHEQQFQEEIDSLRKELDTMKTRCEKAEREKSDIMLRRLASMETTTSKTTASEVLKLQQKCNELKTTVEDLKDERKHLNIKVRELEADVDTLKTKSSQKESDQLRAKLAAAETLCEELMEDNEDMKKELKEMEEEISEMQDNFREDQADEYSSLKKELEQTTKNCRILSFKLKKAERKSEQLDAEKMEAERKLREVAGGQAGLDKMERIRQLENELKVANEAASRLQKDLDEAKTKADSKRFLEVDPTGGKKKPPTLGSMGKSASGEKIPRATLTRGGSQEDPVQLLRDLQESLEREADLREQLRQAEEEARILQKKVSRVEDDNESLVLQLKKMATKARTRRSSPTPQRLAPESPVEKDEGISDEEDPAELRILLELNEQEAAVLRRKVEELETEGDTLKKRVSDLQTKLAAKTDTPKKSKVSEPIPSDSVLSSKVKVMDEEMNDLRKKLIEKERECERLHAEISLGGKKPKVLQKSKSLDADQQAVDLRRQLQVVENEANVLRTKTQSLESENEKLQAENKKLGLLRATRARSSSIERVNEDDKGRITALEKQLEESKEKIKELEKSGNGDGGDKVLKTKLKKLETEKKKLEDSMKRLTDFSTTEIVEFYRKRTPRVPTDLTTKLQLKKMVEESESEIGELLASLKKSPQKGGGDSNLKEELSQIKQRLEETEKKRKEDASKAEKEIENLNKSIKTIEEEKSKLKKDVDKNKVLQDKEKQKAKDEVDKERKSSSQEVAGLKEEIKKLQGASTEAAELKKKVQELTTSLDEEKKRVESLKKDVESSTKTSAEKAKLTREMEESTKKTAELEKRTKELEEKLRKSEKLVSLKKEKITKLEKEHETSKTALEGFEKEKESLLSSQKQKEGELKKTKEELASLQQEVTSKASIIEKLEKSLKSVKESGKGDSAKEALSKAEISKLEDELNKIKKKEKDLQEKCGKAEKELQEAQESLGKKEKEYEKELTHWERKASELEMDLQVAKEEIAAERKMMERLKATHEKEMKAKEIEVSQLSSKSLQSGTKKASEIKQELEGKIQSLEIALESEKREYDELTGKYEQLEEEHVITKSQLVKEKEKLHGTLLDTERDLVETEAELKALRETYNTQSDAWIIEKLHIQDQMKENEGLIETVQLEKARLQAICDERLSELDQTKRESQCLREQIDMMKKENEELRSQMDDYEKVAKHQRNMNADVSSLEKELREAKTKLAVEEKSRKTDLAALKSRYESRVTVISKELDSTQAHLVRFKKERDSYKHMMDEAQKQLSDMRASGGTLKRSYDKEETTDQISMLEQQISMMEDELSEARVEGSRLRTELVSERSAWEVRVSELTSRLNELEEEKILSSGRTRLSGLKTKMELAWQKEREDQQRLLQETSTLARDLRQTLFEVERERDKERLEAKRRLEQQRKTFDEEQEEVRKKLNEMHCDLLELRDAHAKLRTTNEKLRREKEKWEKDRDIMRQAMQAKKRMEQEEERRIISMAQLVEELTVLAPGLFPSKPKTPSSMPTPPVRRKGKSRESSPGLERRDFSRESSVGKDDAKSQEVQEILSRLGEAASQLRRYQQASEDREGARKAFSSRRSMSTESESGVEVSRRESSIPRKGTMRKSLSLEQTQEAQAIWQAKYDSEKEGSIPSMQSLDELDQFNSRQKWDPSLDSRLSGGSTRSEIVTRGDKKKRSGIFGKFKKLTRSDRSIDRSFDGDSDTGSTGKLDRGSDNSLSNIDERSNKPFKKISEIFKKSGSTSRGNSMERTMKPPSGMDSMQRPLVNVTPSESQSMSRGSTPVSSKKPPTSGVTRRTMK